MKCAQGCNRTIGRRQAVAQGWTYRVNGWTCPQCSYAAEVEIRRGSGLPPAKRTKEGRQ